MKKPKPVVIFQECDVCGEDWDDHPENPTVLDCIELLKRRPEVVYREWWQNPGYPYRIDAGGTSQIQPISRPLNICSATTTDAYVTFNSNDPNDVVRWLYQPDDDDDDDGTAGVAVPA